MSIEIPADWPVRNWVEDTPIGHLDTVPHNAPSGTVPVRWSVASWESTREIKASSLPGQVRTRTGLSVGTGKCLVKRQPDDFPWKQSLVYDLTGSDAQILIAPEGRTKIPTGQFRVAPVEGDLTTVGVAVDLDERTIEGTDKAPGVLGEQWTSAEQFEASQGDPIWMVADLAEQMGYYPGPSPVPGVDFNPVLDVPLQGSPAPRWPVNTEYTTNDSLAWGSSEGNVGLSTELDTTIAINYQVKHLLPTGWSWTFDVSDRWASIEWDNNTDQGRFKVEVETNIGDSEVRVHISSYGFSGTANAVTASGPLDITRNPDLPNRIQVEVTNAIASDTGFNSASVRIRRQNGPWFGPFVHAMPNQQSRIADFSINVGVFESGGVGPAVLSNVSVVDHASTSAVRRDELLTTVGGDQGRIYLEPLVGTTVSPWLDPDLSVWTTMQAIVEAWQGALITDVYGDLRVLNRLTLAGLNNLQQERIIDVGLNFEDVPWVMDYADQADRLVVKYRPVVTQAADPGDPSLPVIYEFQDVIGVPTTDKDVFFTLDYIYPVDLKILPFVRKDNDDGFRHVWDAYRYNNGTGNHIDPETEIGMRIDRVTSSTWKVFIENRTNAPFHMVDNTGTPWLKIRSSYYLDQTVEQTIERGLSSSDAQNALEVDLGHYVQTEEDANAIADYLWGRVNARSWRAKTVTMIPDYRVDLGDVVELRHARTGILTNALVTKVHMAGELGLVRQQVDLVLIPPTWEDFDEAWANALPSSTWNTFDALWDAYTWNDFDRTPVATTVAEIEGGM